jgi:hypothetical protein
MSSVLERVLAKQLERKMARLQVVAKPRFSWRGQDVDTPEAAAELAERDRIAKEEAAAALEAYNRDQAARRLWAEYDALERANKPCPRELLDKCLATPRPEQYIPTKEELRKGFAKKRFEVKHFTFKADPTLDGYCGGGISAGRVIRSSGGIT